MSAEGDRDGPSLVSTRTMDIVVALLFLAASAIVITDSLRLGRGWREIEGPAAGYFPFYVGLIMAAASAVNLLRAVFDRAARDGAFVSRPAFRQVLAVLLPLAVYVGAVGFIGIYVASAIYMALFMWYFGKYAPWRGALVGIGVAVFFFLMFEIWFLTPLPKGPLEELFGY